VEGDLLDHVAAGRRPTSRLGCQLVIEEAHEGLVLRLPEKQ
jgi:2Fe-2S ferredoxin